MSVNSPAREVDGAFTHGYGQERRGAYRNITCEGKQRRFIQAS